VSTRPTDGLPPPREESESSIHIIIMRTYIIYVQVPAFYSYLPQEEASPSLTRSLQRRLLLQQRRYSRVYSRDGQPEHLYFLCYVERSSVLSCCPGTHCATPSFGPHDRSKQKIYTNTQNSNISRIDHDCTEHKVDTNTHNSNRSINC
jgi:hypothetical protein